MAEPPRGLLIGILIGAGALLFVMRGPSIPIVNFNVPVSFGSGPTSLSQPRGGHVFEFDKDLLLKRHNYHRCQHEVEPLMWSDTIAGHAQEHADSAGGQLVHSSQIFRSNVAGYAWIGENLFLGDATMKEAVDAWYGEVGLTDDGRVKDFDESVGHYTQLVWKDTKEVGCGFHGMLLVCEYGSAGNVLGQFAAKVPRRIHDKKCPWSDPPEKARLTEERGQSGTVLH